MENQSLMFLNAVDLYSEFFLLGRSCGEIWIAWWDIINNMSNGWKWPRLEEFDCDENAGYFVLRMLSGEIAHDRWKFKSYLKGEVRWKGERNQSVNS